MMTKRIALGLLWLATLPSLAADTSFTFEDLGEPVRVRELTMECVTRESEGGFVAWSTYRAPDKHALVGVRLDNGELTWVDLTRFGGTTQATLSSMRPETAKPRPEERFMARKKNVVFALLTLRTTGSVTLAGSFNDWDPKRTPMKDAGNGLWEIEVPLLPGQRENRFVVDGQWIRDPNAEKSTPNPHGGDNSVRLVQKDKPAGRNAVKNL